MVPTDDEGRSLLVLVDFVSCVYNETQLDCVDGTVAGDAECA